MKEIHLSADQIITLSDYPPHHEQCLKIYFRIFQNGRGRIVPPVPVIHISTGIPFTKAHGKRAEKYNGLLTAFLESHPRAQYFLLDGTHRTTAAALTHNKVPVLLFKVDKDIKEARKLVEQGELFSLTAGGNSIKEAIKTLEKHFLKAMSFQTVIEKTERMVSEKVLPPYMTNFYNQK
ncbi:hypothetical protein HY493_03855 [Candidatus Woesearchaeota archaeon]|nr:hypothetical protein [Candidatus Woesearchaeota archaeon]